MDDTPSSPAGEIVGSYVSLHGSSANYRVMTGGLSALKEKAIRRQCTIAPTIFAFHEQSTAAEARVDTSLEVLNLLIKASRELPNFAHRCFATGGSFGVLGLICIWIFATAPLAVLCWIISGIAWAIGGIAAATTPPEDAGKNIFHLLYDMDSSAASHWQATNESLSGLAGAEKLWHVTSQTSTNDWRRNGGSSELDNRVAANLTLQSPLFVQTNVTPFCLQLQAKQLTFLPDCIWVFSETDTSDKSTGIYRVCMYSEVVLEYEALSFHEDGDIAADTHVTGRIWQYVNKDGSPDRRFRDNYQLSICEYGGITLHLGSDLTLLFHTSSAPIARQFVEAFQRVTKQEKFVPDATMPTADGTGEVPTTKTDTKKLTAPERKGAEQASGVENNTKLSSVKDFFGAAAAGETTNVKYMIDAGIPVNSSDEHGLVALSFAAEYGHPEVIKMLLVAGANSNIKAEDGTTPLICACLGRNSESIELLLEAKADINAQWNNSTPLGIALYGKCNQNAMHLLVLGADPNLPGYRGCSALEIAISNQDNFIVDHLLLAGADAKIFGTTGYSLLETAIAIGNALIFEALLQYGADATLTNLHGNTPLMDAAIKGNLSIVQVLLRHKVPTDTKNAKGQTALDQAIAMGNGNIVQLLQSAAGSPVNPAPQPFGNTSSEISSDVEKIASRKSDKSYAQLLQELNELIGLDNIKTDVKQLVTFLQVQAQRHEMGLKVPEESLHMVFTGNPGTGKTTIARLIAQIYKSMGILSKGQFVETDRAGLVGGYLGQTAIKTQEVVESALGGVLFIDEAYSLTDSTHGHDLYGQEAVATLLKLMEDHRDDLIVIVAGYTEPMQKFIRSNPGLQSRFNKFLHFDDYAPAELTEIFRYFAAQGDYKLHLSTEARLTYIFKDLYAKRDETFGNARLARNMFEKAINAHANRMVSAGTLDEASLVTLYPEDVPSG